MEMEYRRLGGTGLKVSVLSFGSWVTFGPQLAGNLAEDCLAAAYDAGVNFFDNAEAYAGGESERIMGEAIRALGWPRHSYVLSTKLFWGLHSSVNMRNTLNRKYLMQAIDGSLERLGLDFVDLVYCHRPDPETPVEETVWAMSDMITAGKAHYWGTSEWSAEALREAWDVADRHHLHKPVVEQPQYNLLWRDRVEQEYAPLVRRHRTRADHVEPAELGTAHRQVPRRGARGLPGHAARLRVAARPADRPRSQRRRSPGSRRSPSELDCTLAQMSIAWCVKNPHVSTVITGASRVEQVHENLAALDVVPKLTDDVMARIAAVVA